MNTYDIGDIAQLRFSLADGDGNPANGDTVILKVRDPSGTITTHTYGVTGYITNTATGEYQAQLELDQSGRWDFRWEATEPTAAEPGSLAVREEAFSPDAVSDLRDTRVLIPRVRRALLGPHANTPNADLLDNLTDSEVNAVVADAVAEIVLFSGTAFGKTLEVAARDQYYQAPIAWRTSEALTEPEATVIACQAALTFFFQALKNTRTSESITRADETWSYTVSANVLQEQIQVLRANRDAAIEQLRTEAIADTWINTLAVRDGYTDSLIEPWAQESGVGGTIEVVIPDFRFGTVDFLPV